MIVLVCLSLVLGDLFWVCVCCFDVSGYLRVVLVRMVVCGVLFFVL